MKKVLVVFFLIGFSLCLLQRLQAQSDTIITLKMFEVKSLRWSKFTLGSKQQRLDKLGLAHLPTATLTDVLSENTIMFVKSYGIGSLATTSFRGGNASHTAVLWNGLNITSPFNALIDFSLIPANAFNTIDVGFGGSGGVWGSGAVGGAIHLQNNLKYNTGINTTLAAEIGSFGRMGSAIGVGYGGKKSAHQIHVLGNTSQNNFNYWHPAQSKQEQLTNAALNNLAVISQHQIKLNPKNTLSLGSWYQKTNRQIPPTILQNSSHAFQFDESLRFSANYSKLWGNNLVLHVRGGVINEFLRYVDSTSSIFSNNQALKAIAESELIYSIKNHAFNFGLNETYSLARGENYLTEADQHNNAVFVGYSYVSNNNKWNVSANLRQAQQNRKFVPLTYYAGVNYMILSKLKLYGNITKVYRLPAMNDLFWRPGGNINLNAEDGITQEIGLEVAGLKLFDAFSIQHSSTVFNRTMQNWIIWLPQSGLWTPDNILEVWSRGYETQTNIEIPAQNFNVEFFLNTNYILSTYQKAISINDNSVGNQLVYTPMYSGSAGLKIRHKKAGFIYNQQYVGYRYLTSDNTQFLPPYYLASAAIFYQPKFKSQSFIIHFRINNLFNTSYQVVQHRPMPQINYQLSIQINFKSNEN